MDFHLDFEPFDFVLFRKRRWRDKEKGEKGAVRRSREKWGEREDETKKRKNRKRLMKRMIFAAVCEHVCVRAHAHTFTLPTPIRRTQ